MDGGDRNDHLAVTAHPARVHKISLLATKRPCTHMADSYTRPSDSNPAASSSRTTPRTTSRDHRVILPPLEPSIRTSVQSQLSSISGMPPPSFSVRSRRQFDNRRPVSNSNGNSAPADVVDLTGDDDGSQEEQEHPADGGVEIQSANMVHEFNRTTDTLRLPRFGRDIVDLVTDSNQETESAVISLLESPEQPRRSLDQSGENRHHLRTPYRENTPYWDLTANELAVVHHRRRETIRRTAAYNDPPTPSPPRHRPHQQQQVDLTETSDPVEDDLVITEERLRPNLQPNLQSPTRPAGRNIQRTHNNPPPQPQWGDPRSMVAALQQSVRSHDFLRVARERFGQAISRVGFVSPQLDYVGASFDFNSFLDNPGEARPTPYHAPATAPEGFTRSPVKTEEVVCPACGDPLAHGASDEKRQVWVVKACGHVYCGTCILNRSKARGKSVRGVAKNADPPPGVQHFAECLVDGCKSNVRNKTSVFQVFL